MIIGVPPHSGIRFEDEYVGLLWSAADSADCLVELARQSEIDCWIYRSSQLRLAVITSKRHGEPIMEFCREAHERVPRSSSLIGGLVRGGKNEPPPTDAYVIRFRSNQFNEAMLDSMMSFSGGTFCVSFPDTDELVAIVSTDIAVKLFDLFPTERVVTGLNLVAQTSALAKVTKPKHQYDPIGSQIAEVVSRSSVASKESLRNLRQKWTETIGEPPPRGISAAEMLIDEFTEKARNSLRLQSDQEEIAIVDAAARIIRQADYECNLLTSCLAEYSEPRDPWSQDVPYSERARQMFLKAARNLSNEIVDRMGAANRLFILPTFMNDFTYHAPFDGSYFGGFLRVEDDPGGPKKTVMIGCPRNLQLRLGALPILAHGIAHEFIRSEESLYSVREKLTEFLLPEILDRRSPSQTIKRVTLKNWHQLPPDERAMLHDMAKNWAEELFCDLVGVMTLGPAFLWSFFRFLTGTLNEFTDSKRGWTSRTHPPLTLRASAMLETMKWMGLPSEFHTRFPLASSFTVPTAITAAIYRAIPRPYSLEDHKNATGSVKAALQAGRMVSSAKTLILNAMWDGVIRADGYVNEVAVALSLLGETS
jgi:hypothetical protein